MALHQQIRFTRHELGLEHFTHSNPSNGEIK